jgi:hypothetical protein
MKRYTDRLTCGFAIEELENRRLLSVAAVYDSPSSEIVKVVPRALPRDALAQVAPMILAAPVISGGIGLSDQDVGAPAQSGSIAYSNGTYTVVAGGTGVGGTSDQFDFGQKNLAGDGSVVARLTSLANSSSSAMAGVMIRGSSNANSATAALVVTPANLLEFITRTADGVSTGVSARSSPSLPVYLRLTCAGNAITGDFSVNGVTWTQVGSIQTIDLPPIALAGLATASGTTSGTTTATYTDVSLLPGGWNDNDIGAPPLPGWSAYDSSINAFTIAGSGSGTGSAADQFNFANHAITGDATVMALLNSQSGGTSAKAGVMVRADTTSGSLFAGVDQTAQGAVAFEWRSASGAFTSAPISATAPVWVRLSDAANNFSAFYSVDGVTWTQIGTTQSIAMPGSIVLGGVWASSGASALNTASFSAVSITRGGWSDSDIGAPAIAGSAVYDAPSDTFTVSASGSDIFGSSDQFNFVSTTLTGDGSALAYVGSLTNTDPNAKAGIMFRTEATAASPFAGLFATASNGITFEWRPSGGAATQQEVSSPIGGPVLAPVGLKLTRSGATFTAFYSTDGITWIQVGPSQTATIPTTALAGLAVTSHNNSAVTTATFTSVGIGNQPPPGAGIYSASDQLFLNDLENREVLSFYNDTNTTTGLVPDNVSANGGSPSSDASIAAIGFGLSALTIADARGWLSHAAAYQRALNTINFLATNGANVNGFFYHFLNETTGARFGSSEVSSVDTTELMAGVLNVAQYWTGTALQTTASALYNRVNWPWMQQSTGVFYGAWTPESGFSGGYGDFSEAALLYLLSLGSSTHPASQSSWLSWSRTPVVHYSNYTFVTADDAALFTVQYPMAWFNLQGLTDSRGLNYYANAQTATLAQRQFMTDLNSTYSDYGPNLWGLTPSEGPNGYTVWGGPPANGPIDGTVVPTAPGGSLAFTPRLSVNVLENMKQTYGSTVYQKYGLVDAFNPLTHWTSSLVLGIDVGMTLIAAENSRSNMVWNIFNQNPAAQQAIAEAFPSSAASAWGRNSSGDWNTPANWTNVIVPNAAGAEADFLGAIPSGHTVFSDTPITVGTLNFNNPNTYVITGAGSLTLQSATGNAQIIVQQGTQIINLPLTIASNTIFNVASGATLIIGDPVTLAAGATITTVGGGSVIYQSTTK